MVSSDKTYCIFSALYAPSVGGVEKYTQNLAYALADAGNEVVVVVAGAAGAKGFEEPRAGVTVVRLPGSGLLGGRFPVPKPGSLLRERLSYVRDKGIDYVVVNTRFYLHSLIGLKFARQLGVRPVLVEHGSAHLTMGGGAIDRVVAAYEHAVTRLVKRANPAVYAVSSAGCRWLRHFDIEALGVLNNSIDADLFRSMSSGRDFRGELGLGESTLLVSSIGRLVPEKGVTCILEAARALRDADVRFVLAGDGPLRAEVEGCGCPNVTYVGRLSEGDVSALLRSSDAFCLPSRSEGFSTSLLECAACAAVPIVTHVGGVDELIPDESYGRVIGGMDPALVAGAVRELAADREGLRRMAEKLQCRVDDEFSWQKTAGKVERACAQANGAGAGGAYSEGSTGACGGKPPAALNTDEGE